MSGTAISLTATACELFAGGSAAVIIKARQALRRLRERRASEARMIAAMAGILVEHDMSR